ncbi:MAG: aminotransferase class I/II-fold pyridoxal phosphate-dependent enzyme [Deltaproteobacteria bacterium]|nr:aminotransferase class I/II-fold pyridoxal phosphate-dependent enzyme [Deltaproteobacteria bacterium]
MGEHLLYRIPLGGIVSVRDRLLELQAKGRKVYRLESGDPSFSIPDHVRLAMIKALEAGHTHYTAGAGIQPLREAAARKMVEENRIALRGSNSVFVTNGAMHGLYVVFRALLEPGDEVLLPDPTWTETFDNVSLAGGVPVRVRLDPECGYRYQAERIEAAITARTRALVINSPHNPTGLVLDRAELQAILKVAERRGLWVVSDEAYEHVLYDGREHVSAGSLGYEKVISIFSMSKSYAMSGLRVGYLACNDERIAERLVKLLRCTINGVNSVAQHGAVAALTGPQDATRAMAAEYQKRRDALWSALQGVTLLHPFKPQGAFYLWARIDEGWAGGRRGWDMTDFLLERGIGSAPGEVFGPSGAGHIRFAFSCSTEQVVAGAVALEQALKG